MRRCCHHAPPLYAPRRERVACCEPVTQVQELAAQFAAHLQAIDTEHEVPKKHKKTATYLSGKRSSNELRAYFKGMLELVLSRPELCHTVRSGSADLDGGLAASVCCCAYGVPHSTKLLESAESVVDIADLWQNLLVGSNLFGHDNADGLARHMMVRFPEHVLRLGANRQGASRAPGSTPRQRNELRRGQFLHRHALDPLLLGLLRSNGGEGPQVHPVTLTGVLLTQPRTHCA